MMTRNELGETESPRRSIQTKQGRDCGAQRGQITMSVWCTLLHRAPAITEQSVLRSGQEIHRNAKEYMRVVTKGRQDGS